MYMTCSIRPIRGWSTQGAGQQGEGKKGVRALAQARHGIEAPSNGKEFQTPSLGYVHFVCDQEKTHSHFLFFYVFLKICFWKLCFSLPSLFSIQTCFPVSFIFNLFCVSTIYLTFFPAYQGAPTVSLWTGRARPLVFPSGHSMWILALLLLGCALASFWRSEPSPRG